VSCSPQVLNQNDPPQCYFNQQSVSIAENTAAGAQVVSLYSSTYVFDQDVGDKLKFKLLGGNKNGAWSLSPLGVLTVRNTTALNYEAAVNQWSLIINATDFGVGGQFPNASCQGTLQVCCQTMLLCIVADSIITESIL
jgi:hypothetical protein